MIIQSAMFELKKTVALVGMMGSGKSSIGKLLSILDVPFVDADVEIEKAAKLSIPEFSASWRKIFETKRARFERLLKDKPCLATGGGAFINDNIRTSIKNHSVSVWLNADVETLWKRVKHKSTRPLIRTGNPKKTL